MSCFGLFPKTRKLHLHTKRNNRSKVNITAGFNQIDVITKQKFGKRMQRILLTTNYASRDIAPEKNLISPYVAKEILGQTVQCPNEEHIMKFEGQDLKTQGRVELCWKFTGNGRSKPYYSTFLVTAMEQPPFDAILGYEEANKLGLLEQR